MLYNGIEVVNMFNKKGKSSGLGILGALIVVAVILLRVYFEMGPQNFNIVTIGKYLVEMAIFFGTGLLCMLIGGSERIKGVLSAILIIAVIAIGLFLIRYVWAL